jgi:hypothetical protein
VTTAATETGLVATWLSSVLNADTDAGGVKTLATGGIHEEIDPNGGTYPKVIFRFQGGSDYAAVGADRTVYVNAVYAVYAVWQVSSYGGALDAIAARIKLLLNGKQAAVSGGLILSCVRIAPLQIPGLTNGVPIRMSGGTFRIYSQLTPT